MNIQVYPHRIILNKTSEVNSGEYNVNECTFEFSQEYEGLTKVAVFSLCDGTTKNVTILNNQCIIPVECLQETGQVQIGVYGYATQDNELVLRYSPTPQNFVVRLGSYKEGTQPVAPTPTDWEILVEQVSDIAEDVSSIHEDITGINGEISGINIDIRDLQDTKANISDLAEVAFTGKFSDLKNIPSYATTQQLNQEIQDRQDADVNLQSQIDAISVSSDVVDVVGTYQELVDYDTQHLKDNDIVKVLQDSTHSNALSYYRWDKETSTWSYVGSEGPFYTKSETDALLNDKQDLIDIDNMLSSDLVDDTNSTNKFVTQADITNWNNKEDKSNKVTEINSSSTDTQYPSAKCVYDSQEEQNEHIAELEMLYNAFPTVSDEDTTIQLDNTAKVKFKEIDLKGNTSQVVIPEEQGTSVSNTSIYVSDVDTDKEHTIEMSGNTYQETTTGKNLANFINSNVYVYSSGLPSAITTNAALSNKTNNGYTINYYANSFFGVLSDTMLFEENTDYVFSFNREYKSAFNQRMHILQVNDDNSYTQLYAANAGAYGTPYTYTYSNTTAKKVAFMISTNNSTPNGQNETISEIMVRKSTTSDTYEPYTYGASPNPSYPQTIEVVAGENDITIYKENLFNGEMELGMIHYDTGLNAQDDNRARTKGYIPLFSNTYSIIREEAFSSGQTIGLRFYDSNFNYIGRDAINGFTQYATKSVNNSLDTTKTVAYMRFILTTTNDMSKKFCVVNGVSTTFDSTIPQTYPINLNNIELCRLNIDNTIYKDRIYQLNNKWYLEKNISKVILNGSEGYWFRASINTNTLRFNNETAIPNGYVISAIKIISNKFINGSGPSDNGDYEHIRNGGSDYTNSLSIIIDKTRLPGNTADNFTNWLSNNNVTVYYLANATTTEITDSTLVSQLNALANSTLYATTNINTITSNLLPYIDLQYNVVTPSPSPSRPSVVNVVKGDNTITISNSDNTESQNYPINLGDMELCKIGTYQDYIYESNGNWFKKSNIGKVTLNGSEDWNFYSTADGNLFRYSFANMKSADKLGICLCNKFEVVAKANRKNYTLSGDGPLLDFIDNDFENANAWKYWLNNNNILLYYVLATPTDTQITDTTLITQLNNIKKAYSYETQTNISQTNTDKPFIIYAEAIRSLKDVFE